MKLRTLILALAPLVVGAQEPAKPPADPAKPAAEQAKPAEESKDAATQPSEEAAKAAGEKNVSGSIDVGYRFRSDIAGNADAYRSVVNLGEGPKLVNFDLRFRSPTRKWFDTAALTGLGWGDEPYTTGRLNVFKERAYDLNIDYRNIAYYNFLPSFANPLLDRGILATQRAYDISRRLFDAELRLRPGTSIIPFFQYSRSSGYGRGITDYVQSGNEYPVFNSLLDGTVRFSTGVSLQFRKFHATVEQGGLSFKDDNTVSTGDRNFGNRTTPSFGQILLLNTLRQSYRIRGDGYFAKGIASYTPTSWLDLQGQFLFSQPETSVRYTENATGNFVDLTAVRFFTSLATTSVASSSQPRTSGSFHIELRPLSRIRILESFMTDRLHVASSALLSELTSITPQAISTIGADRFVMNHSRHQTEALFDVARWLTLRGGHRYVFGDTQVRGAQVNGVPFERGELRQHVVLGGAQMRFGQKLRFYLDAEGSNAGASYFRTSLTDYQKGTARVRYQAFGSLAFNGSFTALYNENPRPGAQFSFRSRQSNLGFVWNPNGAKRYNVIGDYTHSSLATRVGIFAPQMLTPELSRYREDAHTGTLLLDCVTGGKFGPRLSAGGSFFKSAGSRPTTYVQPLARVYLPVHANANLFAEWRHYGLGERYYIYEGFRSHVFMIGLRLLR